MSRAPLETDLVSPLPFKRLGDVNGDFKGNPRPETLGLFFLRLLSRDGTGFEPAESRWSNEAPVGVELVDRGLGGWLAVRPIPFGGCGNAPMLIVFRKVFPGGRVEGGSFASRVGALEVEFE